jgi:hypothetical protein
MGAGRPERSEGSTRPFIAPCGHTPNVRLQAVHDVAAPTDYLEAGVLFRLSSAPTAVPCDHTPAQELANGVADRLSTQFSAFMRKAPFFLHSLRVLVKLAEYRRCAGKEPGPH